MFTRWFFAHRFFPLRYWPDAWHNSHEPPVVGIIFDDGVAPQPDAETLSEPYIVRVEPPNSFEDNRDGRVCHFCKMWCPGHLLTYIDGKPVCANHNIRNSWQIDFQA